MPPVFRSFRVLVPPLQQKREIENRINVGRRGPQRLAITEAFPWAEAPRYLIRDRDCVYGAAVTYRLRTRGIRDKPIAPARLGRTASPKG